MIKLIIVETVLSLLLTPSYSQIIHKKELNSNTPNTQYFCHLHLTYIPIFICNPNQYTNSELSAFWYQNA